MQYQETIQGKPLKIIELDVPEALAMSEEGNIVMTEKRAVHITKPEFLKAIKSIENKLGYLEYQISEHNLSTIKRQIEELTKKRNIFKSFIE